MCSETQATARLAWFTGGKTGTSVGSKRLPKRNLRRLDLSLKRAYGHSLRAGTPGLARLSQEAVYAGLVQTFLLTTGSWKKGRCFDGVERVGMAKSLRGIIEPQHIHLDVAVSCKRSILETLGKLAAEDFGLDPKIVHEKLMDRESLGTTGVGGGIAIPHARVEVDELCGLFVRLRDRIGFDSVDGDPVDLVFLLLAPDADNANHLKALSRVARTLKTPGVLESLRGATNVDAAYAALVSESDAEAA